MRRDRPKDSRDLSLLGALKAGCGGLFRRSIRKFRETTGRKQTEEAELRRLASIFESSEDAITSGDLEGVIASWNPGAEKLYGYSADEAVGRTVWAVMCPVSGSDEVERNIGRVRRGEVVAPFDAVHHDRDGRLLHVSVSLSPIKDASGRVTGVAAINRDVTGRKEAEEALKESHDLLRTVMEGSTDAIFVKDRRSRYLMINSAGAGFLGKPAEEIIGKDDAELFSPDEGREVMEDDREIMAAGAPRTSEDTKTAEDGTRTYLVVKGPYRDHRGNVVGVFGISRDITERKLAEEALRESEERLRSAFEDAPIGVALVGLDNRYVRVNQAFCEMLGYSEEELLDVASAEITHPDDIEVSKAYMERILEGGGDHKYDLEKRYIHADGHAVWVLLNVSLVRDARGEPSHYVCQHQDVTERKVLEERLEHRAFHDPLTGLANRALFRDRLELALARLGRREEPIAVLFMDLDDFKVVNDSLGHGVGDRLLVGVARRLKECVRPEDTVARFGGDEFVVLLEGIADLGGATSVAERIAESLSAPFRFGGREVFVDTSTGIALATEASEDPENLVREADLALYSAKKRGKARYEVFDASMGTEVLERLDLESALRKGLEHEEFRVYYQPKLSTSTGRIVSMEALVRWEHPRRGLLEPDAFLPVAEENGSIVEIGGWVLDEVCRQGREWQEWFADYLSPIVSTNVSARQFLQTDLVGKVTESLRKSGLRAQGLALEVPEGVLMDDAAANVEKLTALKDLGISIVIDDFGTAYSSFSYLKSFPLNFLKIDRSLTIRLGEEPEDKAIVSAVIELAHALGWAVTAQGVETAEQLAQLRELGCDMAQGYYFSRPVTGEEATALLKANLISPRPDLDPRA